MPRVPHAKVTMSGIFEGSGTSELEIFSMSFAIDLEGVVPSQAQTDAMALTDPTNPIVVWFGSADAAISKDCRLQMIKVAPIGADGKYPAAQNSSLIEFDQGGGYGGGVYYPSTTSYAVSLRTATRGQKGRGRFFVPAPNGMELGESYMWDPTKLTAAVTAAKTMLNSTVSAMGEAAGVSAAKLVVASAVAGNLPVTELGIGSVPDNIRRRKNALDNAYTFAEL